MTGDRRELFDASYFERPSVRKTPAAARSYARLMRESIGMRATVVDVGCASGSVAAAVPSIVGWHVVGVDISATVLGAIAGASAACATTYRLPLRTGSADGVFLLDVVEHLENPMAALMELRRVVRLNGTLVISTPNAGSPLRLVLGRRWHGLTDDTHLYFFTSFTLGHLLRKTGWRVERAMTTSSVPGVGRVLARTGIGGELCMVATAVP